MLSHNFVYSVNVATNFSIFVVSSKKKWGKEY